MPPPRRRRPVQPATRVRLPRAARPGTPTPQPSAADQVSEDDATVTRATPAAPAPAQPASGARAEAAAPARTGTAVDTADADLDEPDDLDELDDEDPAFELDEDEDDDEDAPTLPADQPAADRDRQRGRDGLLLPVCLGVAAVTLGSLAVWFGLAAAGTGSGVDTQNTALLDQAATTQANQQIDQAFSTVFSYDYADTAKTLTAARTLLTGPAIGEYQKLFKLVTEDAPKEKLVLTTTVTNSGVEMLSGNQARVLIFANQKDVSASHQTTDAGAMLAINAIRQNGQWKINSIDTFSAGT